MNIMNKVTLQYLRKNRRRTIVTILGVIISAAMIAAVSTFADSFMSLMQRDTIYTDGEWHAQYLTVSPEDAKKIRTDQAVSLTGFSRELGYFKPAQADSKDVEYLYLQEFDAANFSLRNVRLTGGRMPQAAGEIIVSGVGDWGLKPGDTITGELGYRQDGETGKRISRNYSVGPESYIPEKNARYTVVGVFEELRPSSWRAGDKAYALLDGSAPEEPVNVTVRLKQVGADIYHDPCGFKKYAADGVNYNDDLLRYMGILTDDGVMTTLYTAAAIVAVIIMAGSVLLIYNAFAISISERSRQLGMLSSVGATKKQKRNSVFFEGFLIGVIAIPLGIFFGILGIGITFTLISPLMQNLLNIYVPFAVEVSPVALLGAGFFSVLTIFISVLRPALRASHITPIEAIRQTQDIALTGKVVKTSGLVRRVFGFEGELALKNLKRNRKRYRTTILSLTVSLLLFLTASAFMHYMSLSYRLTDDDLRYDISLTLDGKSREELEEVAQKAAAIPGVTEATLAPAYVLYGSVELDAALITEEMYRIGVMKPTPDTAGLNVVITTMDDAALERYCEKAGIDPALMKGGDHPAILINPVKLKRDYNYQELRQLKLKAGETLDISCNMANNQVDFTGEMVPFRIVAQTPEVPVFRSATIEYWEELTIVVPYKAYWDIYEGFWKQHYVAWEDGDPEPGYSLNVRMDTTDPAKVEEQVKALRRDVPDGVGTGIYNVSQSRQQMEQLSTLVSVFLYGFVILITLISVANIFNTISTSVGLRQREFAMLKSVGMTPGGFNRMIRYESVFYGLKALLYGLPLGFLIMYGLYRVLQMSFTAPFSIPLANVAAAIVGVFAIVGATMLYSGRKVKRCGIIDALTDENL